MSDDSALVSCTCAAQFVQGERSCSGAALALGASLECSEGGGLGTARVRSSLPRVKFLLPDQIVQDWLIGSPVPYHER